MFWCNNCGKPEFSRGELVPDTSDEEIQGMHLRMEKQTLQAIPD